MFQLSVVRRPGRSQQPVIIPGVLKACKVIIMFHHQGGNHVRIQVVKPCHRISQTHGPEIIALPGIRPQLVIIRILNQIIGNGTLEYRQQQNKNQRHSPPPFTIYLYKPLYSGAYEKIHRRRSVCPLSAYAVVQPRTCTGRCQAGSCTLGKCSPSHAPSLHNMLRRHRGYGCHPYPHRTL